MKTILFAVIGVLITFIGSTAHSKDSMWKTNTGVNAQGKSYASMYVSKHEFSMEFNCNETDKNKGLLSVKFSTGSLPKLHAVDGEQAKIKLVFRLKDGDSHIVPWEAYFVSDTPNGSGAWLGKVKARSSFLNALAAAQKFALMNKNGELIYKFGTKRTAVGVKAIRAECGLGR